MKKKRGTIDLSKPEEGIPVRIVGDAAIAQHGLGEGKLIPLLILDTRNRPDIDELIRVHEHLPPGDVLSQWAQVENRTGTISLILQFQRPSKVTIIVEFDIVQQGVLVDQILRARTVFLQAGRPGDRFITNPDAQKISAGIAEGGFSGLWDSMWHKHLTTDMRASGLKRSEAKRAARQVIDELRSFSGRVRIPD
jgi:hypothetical protein